MKVRPSILFAILGTVCVIGAFATYWYITLARGSVVAVGVKDNVRSFQGTLESTTWLDTGIWIEPGSSVSVTGEVNGQPFELSSDSISLESRLVDGVFCIRLGFVEGMNFRKDWFAFIDVKKEEKVYMRLGSGAVGPARVSIEVKKLNKEQIQFAKDTFK